MEQSGQVGGQAMPPQMNMQMPPQGGVPMTNPGIANPAPAGMPPMPPNVNQDPEQKAVDFSASITNVSIMNEDARIESLLEECVKTKASDLHLQVGLPPILRIDGALQPVAGYKEMDEATVERLVFATLEDDQKQILIKDKEFDYSFSFGDLGRFRVNAFHEKGNIAAAFRLIPNEIQSISELGMPPIVESFAEYPRGLVLVTGPTGSGKSTTLYAVLSELNKPNVNITTVEDPVEKQIFGVNQVQTNAKAGLTFASGLRAILRQDPDIVMIGEIRDTETAEIAIRAAITGHLVLSTLHTNDAASSIVRLIDMGVASYMVASSVNCVVAQRLVKKLCPECKRKREIKAEEAAILKDPSITHIYEPVGCPRCGNTGYKGRTAIYEIIEIDSDLRRMISEGRTTEEIRDFAKEHGATFLEDSIRTLIGNGTTSMSEFYRLIYSI